MNALQVANDEGSLLPENKMIGKQILIVDDQEHLRELVQLCLEDLAGWNTLVAESGQECLQILETERPNAILLDLSMPGMDGFAVYDRSSIRSYNSIDFSDSADSKSFVKRYG